MCKNLTKVDIYPIYMADPRPGAHRVRIPPAQVREFLQDMWGNSFEDRFHRIFSAGTSDGQSMEQWRMWIIDPLKEYWTDQRIAYRSSRNVRFENRTVDDRQRIRDTLGSTQWTAPIRVNVPVILAPATDDDETDDDDDATEDDDDDDDATSVRTGSDDTGLPTTVAQLGSRDTVFRPGLRRVQALEQANAESQPDRRRPRLDETVPFSQLPTLRINDPPSQTQGAPPAASTANDDVQAMLQRAMMPRARTPPRASAEEASAELQRQTRLESDRWLGMTNAERAAQYDEEERLARRYDNSQEVERGRLSTARHAYYTRAPDPYS